MGEPSVEERIAALEAEIEALRRELDAPCRAFLEATERFVAGWFEQHVERTVLGKPDVTKTLSRDALRGLKAELRQLVQRSGELVAAHVGRDPYWPHRRQVVADGTALLNLAQNPYELREGRPPALLNGAILDVLHAADGLLARYGFAPLPRSGGPDTRSIRRGVAFEWTEEMRRPIAVYAEGYARLKRLHAEVLPLRRRRSESETRRLWDQA